MMFIGQVALATDVFGNVAGDMVYLFITDDCTGTLPTWDPDGGENAVIVQPGPNDLPVTRLLEGPSLELETSPIFSLRSRGKPFEYGVDLTFGEDPEPVSETVFRTWDAASQQSYSKSLLGTKVGGTPAWVQGEEYPGREFRKLVLQLEADHPVPLAFGDAGVGFIFIDERGEHAKFVWQGH